MSPLMTPVVKRLPDRPGFDAANNGVQIFGGHGYISVNGAWSSFGPRRPHHQIYEGTNASSAGSGRAQPPNSMGRLARRFFHPVRRLYRTGRRNPAMLDFVLPLASFSKLQRATYRLGQAGLIRMTPGCVRGRPDRHWL